MNPYPYVKEATANGESLLSLCCGIGFELVDLNTQDVTAVDIVPQYLEEVTKRCPQAKVVSSDVLEYTKKQPDNSVDIISIIDGIEHLDEKTGLELIVEMKRVCRKKILLFTPQGYLRNEPLNAWGLPIEGADEYQKHKSGWPRFQLEDLDFQVVEKANSVSQHGEPYVALMTVYTKGDKKVLTSKVNTSLPDDITKSSA